MPEMDQLMANKPPAFTIALRVTVVLYGGLATRPLSTQGGYNSSK